MTDNLSSTLSDEAELAAWRRGDVAAGQRLLARHFPAVCRFFQSKLGDDVEDIIQAVFLAMVHSSEQIEATGFRAYLYATCRNKLFDHLRTRYRQPDHVPISDLSLRDWGTSPSEHMVRDHQKRLVLAALRQLPVDYQIVVELAYWEELNGPEIAHVLGVPANTIRGRLSRARDLLREQLAMTDAGPELFSALAGDDLPASIAAS